MLDLALRNIKRQRSRTFLTMLGIVLGIAAVVALGSMAEGLNQNIQQNLELNAGKVIVSQKGSSGFLVGFAGSSLSDDHVDQIAAVSGVKSVIPQLYYYEEILPFSGPAWVAVGINPHDQEFFSGENIHPSDGRELDDNDMEVMVAGSRFAEKFGLEPGDFFTIKDTDIEVVGVLEQSDISNIDDNFVVPLATLQDITDTDTVPVVYAIPDRVEEAEALAVRIEETDEELDALTSTDIARQASEIVGQVRVFTFGIGAIAALVGGLGIMNTMIMAVLERRREIGVMKAVGATRRQIMLHFLTEALVIAFLGGVIGVVVGAGGSRLLGLVLGFAQGAAITAELIGWSLLFAILLGLAGGCYPAWKAAKLDPVEALRYE